MKNIEDLIEVHHHLQLIGHLDEKIFVLAKLSSKNLMGDFFEKQMEK